MAAEITEAEKQALAELAGKWSRLDDIERVFSPANLAKAEILLLYLNSDPAELMALIDGISKASRASPGLERLSPHAETLLAMARTVEAEAVMWDRIERWRKRFGLVGALAAGGVAAWAWTRGLIAWPPPH
tara:strand:- start:8421 stop:8813 length:393 start_codon:yes stop_codon:yes gene_type:complete